jgi:hypothetical protein
MINASRTRPRPHPLAAHAYPSLALKTPRRQARIMQQASPLKRRCMHWEPSGKLMRLRRFWDRREERSAREGKCRLALSPRKARCGERRPSTCATPRAPGNVGGDATWEFARSLSIPSGCVRQGPYLTEVLRPRSSCGMKFALARNSIAGLP